MPTVKQQFEGDLSSQEEEHLQQEAEFAVKTLEQDELKGKMWDLCASVHICAELLEEGALLFSIVH